MAIPELQTRAAALAVVESLERRALFTVTPDPGADFATAFNVGDLQGQRTFNDSVGPSDLIDAYKFTMLRDGQFFGRLRTASARADLTLIRESFDANGHVQEDFVAIKQANQDGPDAGFASGNLPVQFLKAGTYFLFVSRLGGDTEYQMRMTADYAGNSLGAARDIGSASDAVFQDFVGTGDSPSLTDPSDFYKVKMDASGRLFLKMLTDELSDLSLAHIEMIHDFNGNGVIDPGDDLIPSSSSGGGSTTQRLTKDVPAGTYFVRVASDLNFTNYHLRVTADYARSTPGTQRDMGSLDAGKSFNDFISTSFIDTVDQYTFSVGETRPLNLVFIEGNGGKAEIAIFKDRNLDGIGDADTETVLSTGSLSFSNFVTTVDAGNYIVQIKATSGEGTYQLFAEAPPDRAGNTLGTAKNLGTINGLTHLEDYASETDPVDFYRFTASAAGRVSAQLLPALGGNVDLALIRDANNNGKVDPAELLASHPLPGNQTEELSASIAAGNYFLRVTYNDVFSTTGKYFLSFHTDYAGSTPATARNVGLLSGTRGFDDWASGPFAGVISDKVDLYKFNITSTKSVNVKLTGTLSGQDLALQIFRDKNNNGVFEANELVAATDHLDSPNEQITKSLAAGTYFARVVGVNGETNYHLALRA